MKILKIGGCAMVSFIVPVGGGGPEFRFSVCKLGVLFAGSRHGEVPVGIEILEVGLAPQLQ